MSESPTIYKLAFKFLKRSSPELLLHLQEKEISHEDFFTLDTGELSFLLRLPQGIRFEKKEREEALRRARTEYDSIERHNISVSLYTDEDYPVRLYQIPDAPVAIFKLGNANLDSSHIINIVGTRRSTPYGIDFCKRLVADLGIYFPDLVVVSGLAYGIDANAHMASLESKVTTVGVVAHGLNMIYPAAHRDLAKRIIQSDGSLVSEYPFGEPPFRQRFLERNRIIAGLADVTIIAESDLKGGAMSTANYAFSYSREVMALPGRISDQSSAGCNHLIRREKAHLVTCAADVIELMDWKPLGLNIDTHQRNLFPELYGDCKLIYETIKYSREPMQTDRIHQLTLIPMSRLMETLSELEFDGIIIRHPGNRYSLS